MPLDRTNGEYISGLGKDFEIMPTEIYARSEEFHQACSWAAEKLKDAGAISQPVKFYPDDVLVQYYPRKRPAPLLVFIFCKKCQGGQGRESMPIERYVTYEYSVVEPTVNAVGHA